MASQKTKDEPKPRALFDHINEIRYGKSTDYYKELTDHEKKSFNPYMILVGLSMDRWCIQELGYVSPFINTLPPEIFYKVCCDLLPPKQRRGYFKWVKSSTPPVNKEILEKISMYYEVGLDDAKEYYFNMISNDVGIRELNLLLSKYGYTDKEIERLLK